MKVLTWNVNGLRSLIQYHPWCEHKCYKTILDALDADVICFQETKLTPDRLDSFIALVPGYDAYFSMTKNKTGYSGVVTYVKTDKVVPVAAEEGISGVLYRPGANQNRSKEINRSELIGHWIDGYTTEELLNIDSEGRCVILDFGFFVLFNVYCPHESNTERLPFKLQYYNVLQERTEKLLKAGRQVVIAGDINVTHKEIDHCNPQRSVKEHALKSFSDHPARKWIDGFLAPEGVMIDLCRNFHPEQTGMFTCWNTLINARPINYGTRLDYILVSEDLVKWFKTCDILPNVMGSDHCPVVAEFFDEIISGEQTIKLVDQIKYVPSGQIAEREPPKLCAKYMSKFSGTQQTLKNFFSKADSVTSPVAVSKDGIKPKPFQKTIQKPASSRTKSSKQSSSPKSKKRTSVLGQPSLVSFLQQSDAKSTSDSSPTHEGIVDNSEDQSPINRSNALDLSPSEHVESPEQCLSAEDEINDIGEEYNEIPVDDKVEDTRSQWNNLFTPPPIPKCITHCEPCKEYRVNKSGPNKGRRFFLCSRPVGPTPNDRCDYFEWAKGKGTRFSLKRANTDKSEGSASKKKR